VCSNDVNWNFFVSRSFHVVLIPRISRVCGAEHCGVVCGTNGTTNCILRCSVPVVVGRGCACVHETLQLIYNKSSSTSSYDSLSVAAYGRLARGRFVAVS